MQPDTCVKHVPCIGESFHFEDEPVWLNGWVFVLELRECGLEPHSSYVIFHGANTLFLKVF